MTILVIHEILSVILFYTCFCRAVKTDSSTRREILLSFWALSMASVVCIFAPLAFNWQPDSVSMILLLAVVIVQVTTSTYWRQGVPRDYHEAGHAEKQRPVARDSAALRRS